MESHKESNLEGLEWGLRAKHSQPQGSCSFPGAAVREQPAAGDLKLAERAVSQFQELEV